MEILPNIIQGGSHTDQRGTICFVNEFDMEPVRRFYCIQHPLTSTIRAWRGHKMEQRWFHVRRGAFMVKLVYIDNWENPSRDLEQKVFILKAENNSVLHIPNGFASGIQALEENSDMVVFADYGIENAPNDDYLFPMDYFGNW